MAKLESYIFARMLRMSLTALIPVLAIIWTTQVLGRLNLVTNSGQSISSFFMLATYLLPTIIPIVLPFALSIGVTQTLNTMNVDSEMAVIDAAGAPRKMIYKPALILAALTCVVSFTVDNMVEPVSRLAMRQTIAAAYADLLSTVIEEKTFRRIDEGLYVEISERGQGRTLRGLFVADSRDPRFEMLYYAREGAVDAKGGTLIMKDGEIHRKTLEGSVSVIHFDSYSFDLSELSEQKGQARLKAGDRDLLFLLNPDLSDRDYLAHPADFRAELHRRLTDWFFPVTFALMSLVAAGSSHSSRELGVHPLVYSLGFGFVYRWLTFFLADRIESETGTPEALYLFVILTNIALVMLLVRKSARLGRRRIIRTSLEFCMSAVTRLLARFKSGGKVA
ncbi:LptF/LptG family permease [Rhizobium alvei]|uniref:LptF/LptG family permease n=1 Tax=Rhizobium alvei TaxID=1132659 RepID=A0ABT8YJI3_9HYPH|nr:LptF/LptG family permease [Rhizobium alvei]MDO6963681.1 LptF/LptG family permease [Rhizobium alvei]